MERKQFVVTLAVGSAALAGHAHATIVFSDGFEYAISNATTYNVTNTSQQVDTAKWVRATSGFNANRNGIVNESRTGESFTDPVGSQAWAGRYSSNTGVTSAAGVIGTLALGQTITVTFDSVIDGFNSGSAIYAMLVVFDDGAARNAVETQDKNTAGVLKLLTGTATSSYAQYSFTYTVGDPVADNNGGTSGVSTTWNSGLLGKDIGVRFAHRNGALVDNVQVSIVPEPATLGLLGLGGLAMIRRRRA